MRIHVRPHHIAAGKREDCEACPIALALTEATGRQGWEVGDSQAWLWAPMVLRHYPLPDVATRFVHDFDAGRPVRPFSFEVEGP